MIEHLPFVKATACGNDFLLIDGRLVRPSDMKSITVAVCDRHLGVGADGVEWLFPSDDADIRARLLNSDGSEAEVSGNGTRCVAAWYVDRNGAALPGWNASVRVLTDAGLKTCKLIQRDEMEFIFQSDMGEATITGELALDLHSEKITGLQLSMGNPQFIVFVDKFFHNWQALGAEIERHAAFPQRTNVEFVNVTGPREVEIRIYERGAGETQSSGTGSCASAVAAVHSGRVTSPVRVISPGGPQTVEWDGSRVLLTGPARIVCRGEFFL